MHQYKTPQTHLFRGNWWTAKQIAEMTGIPERTIHRRIQFSLSIDGTPRCGPEPKRWNYHGEMLTIAQIMERTGLSRATVSRRMSGQTFLERHELKDAHHEPAKTAVVIFHEGEAKTVSAWARAKGINVGTLHSRIAYGWKPKDALTRPVYTDRQTKFDNRKIISRLIEGVTRISNRQRIERMIRAFRTGGYQATSPHTGGTGLGRHLPETGQSKNPNTNENLTSEAGR